MKKTIKYSMEMVDEYRSNVEKWHQVLLAWTSWSENRERNAAIVRDYLTTDASYRDISKRYGIGHERCRWYVYKALAVIRRRLRSEERTRCREQCFS